MKFLTKIKNCHFDYSDNFNINFIILNHFVSSINKVVSNLILFFASVEKYTFSNLRNISNLLLKNQTPKYFLYL